MYHDLHPKSVAFSSDGSLLGVAYGPVVTLWDPWLNMLKLTLTQPHSQDAVKYDLPLACLFSSSVRLFAPFPMWG